MSFGWDFAPPIRTMGLWDDVSLVIIGPVFIVDASALGQPVLPLNQKSGAEATRSLRVGPAGLGLNSPANPPADLLINLTLDADRTRQVEARVQITPANFEGPTPAPFHFLLDLSAGRSSQRLECHLSEAALWQSWNQGQPHLYLIQITVSDLDSRPLDEITLRTGIRAVELDRWEFGLNGQREFMRGLNWVPADSFPGRLRRDDYARLLTLARQSGANLLRVWGGGLREKQAFYDLCDELGLLIWQEFPLACMFLGSYPRDPAYLSLVEAECGAIVRQLRHHPAVVLWCGGNEFSRRRNRPLVDTLARVVDQNDGTRPFVPVSPSFDHGRDAHNWHVWHGNAPIQAYQAETARFLSEFGLQALPHLDTLRTALPDPSTGWPTHQADLKKLKRYISLFNNQPANGNGPTKIHDLQFTIHNSQSAQAIALQTAIEHMRRRKGKAEGICLWQFNEPWPAISWAIVDYFGRPKLAYQRLSDWYNPILISLKFLVGQHWQADKIFEAEIWAINDSLQSFTGCELQVNLDGLLVHAQTLNLPADSAHPAGTISHRLVAPPRQINLTLHYNGQLLAQNSYDLAWSDESSAGFFHRFRRWLADWVLRL
jgi:beta-mannosidase